MSEPTQVDVVAWVIPGDDHEDCKGFISAMVIQEGEFSRPLVCKRKYDAICVAHRIALDELAIAAAQRDHATQRVDSLLVINGDLARDAERLEAECQALEQRAEAAEAATKRAEHGIEVALNEHEACKVLLFRIEELKSERDALRKDAMEAMMLRAQKDAWIARAQIAENHLQWLQRNAIEINAMDPESDATAWELWHIDPSNLDSGAICSSGATLLEALEAAREKTAALDAALAAQPTEEGT